MLRIVTAEETRIDHDAANYSGHAQTNNAPVVAGCAPPARLPTIHPFSQVGVFAFDKDGSARLKQVFLGREKLIVGNEHCAAKFFRSEINQFSKVHFATNLRDKRQTKCSLSSIAARETSLPDCE